MPNIVYIAASLDGYIATVDGGIDWLHDVPNPTKSDYGWSGFVERIDALIMGRNTYEKVLTFGEWPYEKTVLVATNTLNDVPSHLEGKVRFIKGQPSDLIAEANRQGYESLYIDGGITIQGFLAADLVDELILTHIPVLLGDGYPLFGKLADPLKFRHTKTEIYNDTLVQTSYERQR
jgi:dihydrofolate reductase